MHASLSFIVETANVVSLNQSISAVPLIRSSDCDATGQQRSHLQCRPGSRLLSRASPTRMMSSPLSSPQSSSSGPTHNQIPWYRKLTELVTYGFPIISASCAFFALKNPQAFAAIPESAITVALAVLMLSTGLTLSPQELVDAFKRPLPLLLAFVGCYVCMPLFATTLANSWFAADKEYQVGLLLLGIISGGQASNLCTYIARGDTALSVAMTSVTTLSAVFMLPLLSKLLIGRVIAVSAWSIAVSTIQVVLVPIFLGALINQLFSKFVRRIEPLLPVIGVCSTSFIVLKAVASSQSLIVSSGANLFIPVTLLHVLGGLLGYLAPKLLGQNETTCKTLAIETAFKSPALSFVLAVAHFPKAVAIPSAVSILVLAPLMASYASILRYLSRSSLSRTNH